MTRSTRLRPVLPEIPLASQQHWVVTHDQLVELGLDHDAIEHRLTSGRLHPVHRGVYAVGRPDLSPDGRRMAAALACAPDGVVSHLSAAAMWQLVDRYDGPPHVLVPTQAGLRGAADLVIHRCDTARPEDVTRLRGVPVTTVERTLFDVARTTPKRLKGCVRQAEWRHGVDLTTLFARAQEPRTDVAAARMRRLLAVYVPVGLTESEFEARFLELCTKHRLPRPDEQVWVGRHRADFLWHDVGLVVETDGRATHGTAMAFRDDRVKDRALKRRGLEVLRFTWGEVVHEGGAAAREIREARAALRRRRPGGVELTGS